MTTHSVSRRRLLEMGGALAAGRAPAARTPVSAQRCCVQGIALSGLKG